MQNNSKSMNSDVYISSAWQQHADLITHLCHFSQNILLLLGEKGAGKTAFFEHFISNPGAGLKVCALKADPQNTVEDLLKEVAMGFELNWESANNTTLQVQTHAIAAYQKAHETWMLMIDDAHTLDDVQIAALLQLVQFNDEARQQLHLVLVGESSLETRLFSPSLATWAQGKVYSIELESWTLHDLKRYFSRENVNMPFTPEQIADIFSNTQGLPGRVVQAHYSLQDPFNKGATTMTKQNAKRWTHPIALGAVAGFLLGGSYLLLSSTQDEEIVSAPVNAAQVENNRLDTSDEKMAMDEEPAPVVSMQAPQLGSAKPTAEVSANAQMQAQTQLPTAALPKEEKPQAAITQRQEPNKPVAVTTTQEPNKPVAVTASQEPSKPIAATTSQEPSKPVAITTEGSQQARLLEANKSATPSTMAASLPEAKPAPMSSVAKAPEAVKADNPKKALSKEEEYLLSIDKKYYTLQLVGARNEKSVQQFIQKNELDEHAYVYRTKLSGKDWYVVVLGEYATMDEAKAAAQGIPQHIAAKPWIREFTSIHSDIKKQS
jgi:DamX protein